MPLHRVLSLENAFLPAHASFFSRDGKVKLLLKVRLTHCLLCAFSAPLTPLSQQPGRSAVCNSSFMLPASLCLCQTCPPTPSTGLSFTFLSALCPPVLTPQLSWRHSIPVSLSTGIQHCSSSARPVRSQDYREETVLLCPIYRAVMLVVRIGCYLGYVVPNYLEWLPCFWDFSAIREVGKNADEMLQS